MIRERAGTLEAVLGVNEASGFVHLPHTTAFRRPLLNKYCVWSPDPKAGGRIL